jgi:hypothetical protein
VLSHDRVVIVTGLAYALELLRRAPAHWVRPGTVMDIERMLDGAGNTKRCEVLRKTARRHVTNMLKNRGSAA